MKYTLRLPTNDQYGYIEIEGEKDGENFEGVLAHYSEAMRRIKGGSGVGMKDFAKIVHEYCTTGNIVNGGEHDFSANEKALLGEIKKLVRKDK